MFRLVVRIRWQKPWRWEARFAGPDPVVERLRYTKVDGTTRRRAVKSAHALVAEMTQMGRDPL